MLYSHQQVLAMTLQCGARLWAFCPQREWKQQVQVRREAAAAGGGRVPLSRAVLAVPGCAQGEPGRSSALCPCRAPP